MSSPIRDRADAAHAGYAAAHRELLAAVASLEESGDWRGDGAGNLPAWLAARYQVSNVTARRWVGEARALRVRPDLDRAYADGAVSCDQMQALAVVASPGTDGAWVEVLGFWSIDELQREARKTRARELERRDDGRYLRLTHTPDERYVIVDGRLHPEEGALLQKALDRGVPDGVRFHEFDRYYVDALVGLAQAAVAADADPDRATVVLHVECPDDVAALETGGFVGADTALRMMCDARLETVLERDGLAVGIGRASRVVPAFLYRQLRHRDSRCVFHGCGRTGYLHAHHIVHWTRGGRTDLDNLLLVCTFHHELLHEGRWSLRGEAGPHITWVRPDGTVFAPRAPALVDTS